jgi:hypothetical protein
MLQEMRLPEPCIHSGLMSFVGTFETYGLHRAMSEFEGQSGKHVLVLSSSQFDPKAKSLQQLESNRKSNIKIEFT